MNYLKTFVSIVIMAMALTFTGQAQQKQKRSDRSYEKKEQSPKQGQQLKRRQQSKDIEVSDSELEQFAKVQKEVRKMRQNTRKKMMSAVEEEGLTMKEFSKIRRARMSRDSAKQAQITDDQKKKYKNARKNMQRVQKQSQKKMKQKIQEKDMDIRRFKEISRAVKQDQELQKKMQKMQKADK